MDREARWHIDDDRRGGGGHSARLRPTGVVVFATIDRPVRRGEAALAPVAAARLAPPRGEARPWLRRAAWWLLGR
jgi:hypothetical protein